jgi:hypothetical protein
VSGFQILDGACPAQIEKIGSDAAITGTTALALGNVGEAVFDATR